MLQNPVERPTVSLAALPQTAANILIVEDDDATRILLSRLLCEAGYDVAGAASLAEMSRIFSASNHANTDLILLDIAMPELDGMQTLKLIRKVDRLKHIPVMFLTADGDRLTVIKANEFHADDYIRKPIRADDLIQRVSRILQLRKMKKMME